MRRRTLSAYTHILVSLAATNYQNLACTVHSVFPNTTARRSSRIKAAASRLGHDSLVGNGNSPPDPAATQKKRPLDALVHHEAIVSKTQFSSSLIPDSARTQFTLHSISRDHQARI